MLPHCFSGYNNYIATYNLNTFLIVKPTAIEFKVKALDRLISIPEIYKDWYNNTVRVV